MVRELGQAVKNKTKSQVMDALLENHKIELPKALVSGEIDVLRNQMMQRFGGQQQNFDIKSLLPDTMFEEEAQRRSEERRVGKECRSRWGGEEESKHEQRG